MTRPRLDVVFAEGCFDDFDGSPQELADLLADIHSMAENGTIMDDAVPLNDYQIEELNQELSKRNLRQ